MTDDEQARKLLAEIGFDDDPDQPEIGIIAAALTAARAQADAPIPDTYACQRCGRRDGLDAVAPDDAWEKIKEAAGGVNILCLWCMDTLAGDLGIECSVTLHFAGKSLNGTSNSDADKDFINRLVSQRAEADAELGVMREALKKVGEMRTMPDHAVNTTTLVAAHQIAEHALSSSPRAAAVAEVVEAAREWCLYFTGAVQDYKKEVEAGQRLCDALSRLDDSGGEDKG